MRHKVENQVPQAACLDQVWGNRDGSNVNKV